MKTVNFDVLKNIKTIASDSKSVVVSMVGGLSVPKEIVLIVDAEKGENDAKK